MSDAQFDVERAAAGLVMTLFVVAAVLLAGLLYFVLRDIETRTEASSSDTQAVRVEYPPGAEAPPSSLSASSPTGPLPSS